MSSVIVKGMEMPDSCYHCKIAESCGHYIANYTDRRHPDCPLIALPEHHGRLVDADALRDRLQNLGYDDWNQGTTTTWAEAFNECADMVDEQPTIEPQRKKGHWILVKGSNGKDYHKCSKCLHTQEITGVKNYCAVCGAEMREQDETD